MKNIDCSSCSEMIELVDGRRVPKTREVTLMGQKLTIRNYICAGQGQGYRPMPEKFKLQLSICLTNHCDAECPFCIARASRGPEKIDLHRLEKVLRELKRLDCIRGISITGGEPFSDVPLLDDALCLIFEIFDFGLDVSVSTNGSAIDRLPEIKMLSHLNTVHISRHHYDDDVNRRLFGGASVPTAEALRRGMAALSYPDIYVINCMLLKGGIDSPEEARKFLDFAITLGAPKVAFITGAPVNAYVKARAMNFEDVIHRDDPSMLFTRGFRDFDWCRCQDGVYCSEGGRLIEFYGRMTDNRVPDYCRGLVYDANNRLRAGYNGPIIDDGRD